MKLQNENIKLTKEIELSEIENKYNVFALLTFLEKHSTIKS